VPTAVSATSSQPNTTTTRRSRGDRSHVRVAGLRRLALTGVSVLVGLAIVLPAETIGAPSVAAAAAPGWCSGWTSTTRPPDSIRVLRRSTGRVVRVPFRKYVVTVMGKEWPSYLPQQVIEAGAVAVKQYAWYHALGRGRISRHGQCFDVTDGVGDQLYKPGRARVRPDHYAAIAATWNVRLVKNGSLFMTGYRTGSKGRCGHDTTGWKLYARSAVRCARKRGMGYLQILRMYYGPVAVINGGGNSGAAAETFNSQTSDAPSTSTAETQPATPPQVPAITSTGGTTGGVALDVDAPTSDSVPIGELAFTQA
jgi:hypothetical protein